MPLRYVSVVIKYQEESPPISLGYRVVIPLGGQSLQVTLEGLYRVLEYSLLEWRNMKKYWSLSGPVLVGDMYQYWFDC